MLVLLPETVHAERVMAAPLLALVSLLNATVLLSIDRPALPATAIAAALPPLAVTVLPETVALTCASVASVALACAEAAVLTWLMPPPASAATFSATSLFCNSTVGAPFNGIRAGADVNTWQFADGVHPTTGGHKLISTEAAKILKSYGWI